MHVVKVCRVCLREYDELTPLRAKLPGENKTLVESINFVVNINMKLEAGLPDKICKNCKTVLDLADTFKQRCLESEVILSRQCVILDNEKRADELRSTLESNCQENIEIHSEDTSGLLATMPCSASPNCTPTRIGNEENYYDLVEYKIKMEIVDESTIREQAHLDAAHNCDATLSKSQEQCLMQEKESEILISRSASNERYSCSYCNMTFNTNLSNKVHIFCKHNPKALHIKEFALCKDIFTFMSSCEVRLERISSQKDQNGESSSNSNEDCGAVSSFWEEFDQGKDEADTSCFLEAEAHCTKNLKLGNIQPTSAVETSTRKQQEATVASATPIIKTGNPDKTENIDHNNIMMKKKHKKKLNLDKNKESESYKSETTIKSTHKTGNMLKLSDTNINNKITHATGQKAKCINNPIREIFNCDICKYTTAKLRHLNLHLRAHTAMKRHSCDLCPYITTKKQCFINHINLHKGTMVCCHICQKKFSQRYYLYTHVRTHTGYEPYSCVICKKKFIMKSVLVRHMKTHTDDTYKPYCCDICQKKYKRKCDFLGHKRTHTGDMPYSCEICNRKFSWKCNLVKHLKTHNNRPFSCYICQKKFNRKAYLISHMRQKCTGYRPYSCDICQKKFGYKRFFDYHVKTQHDCK